ncbi:hypothetical protein IAR50_005812 [Cryptococcus sp. DSM 104548]
MEVGFVLVPPGHSWELVVDVEGATGRGRMSEDSVEMLRAMLTRNRGKLAIDDGYILDDIPRGVKITRSHRGVDPVGRPK